MKLLDLEGTEIPPGLDKFQPTPFAPSAAARYRWGRQQEERLVADIQMFMARRPYTYHQHNDEARLEWWLTIEFTDALPLVEWSLRFGDVIHSYRACLDHLMWEAVSRTAGDGGPPDPRAVSFPVYDTPKQFEAWRRRLKVDLDPRFLHRVSLHQPYNTKGPLQGVGEVLASLTRLNNIDKHRILPIMALGETSGRIGGRSEPADVPGRMIRVLATPPLRTGSELVRYRFEQPMDLVEIDFDTELEAAVPLPGDGDRFSPSTMSQLLISYHQVVYGTLFDLGIAFERPGARSYPPEVLEQVGDPDL